MYSNFFTNMCNIYRIYIAGQSTVSFIKRLDEWKKKRGEREKNNKNKKNMEDWKDDVEIFGKVESFVFSWKYVSSFGRRVGLSCASELLELQLECFVHECFQWKGIQHFVSSLRRLRFELFFGLSRAQVLVSKCAFTFDRVKCRRTGNQQFFPLSVHIFQGVIAIIIPIFLPDRLFIRWISNVQPVEQIVG